MKNIWFLLIVVTTVGLQGYSQTSGNAENGRRVFMKKNCYYCHGSAGQGGRDGARIAQTPLAPQALIRYVRRPTGRMPAYTEKILSDQELMDIAAYLKAVPSKDAKDIPLLKQLP
jgi:ubiquinol-cytochrome c reductase cytochrome c subunit